mmetsp:Transcript_64257/g.152037  ORF Transcript_64257/g.152037 Transcript_64257/m.152037 type:complete len:201 (-) Transcript_64257:110-712(-)
MHPTEHLHIGLIARSRVPHLVEYNEMIPIWCISHDRPSCHNNRVSVHNKPIQVFDESHFRFSHHRHMQRRPVAMLAEMSRTIGHRGPVPHVDVSIAPILVSCKVQCRRKNTGLQNCLGRSVKNVDDQRLQFQVVKRPCCENVGDPRGRRLLVSSRHKVSGGMQFLGLHRVEVAVCKRRCMWLQFRHNLSLQVAAIVARVV